MSTFGRIFLHHLVAVVVLLAAIFAFCSTTATTSLSCPSGRNYTLGNGTHVCCELYIVCGPGTEPALCNGLRSDEYGYCQPCPHYPYYPFLSWTFNSGYLTLGSYHSTCRPHDSCKRHGTKYAFEGNGTHNSICECLPGWYPRYNWTGRYDICYSNYVECQEGRGIDHNGGCIDCVLGETYSDLSDEFQECLPVTMCGAVRCTLVEATLKSDAVCTSNDRRLPPCSGCTVQNRATAMTGVFIAFLLMSTFKNRLVAI